MNVEPRIIENASELEKACDRWRRLPAIGVDTEFVRERTFYPALGLVQIADGDTCSLIDPLSAGKLEPLRELLSDPSVLKIFHSCGEDLEALHHRFDAFPGPVFDTQIAAAYAGWGPSLGYGRLVLTMFDVDLPKGQTRTNWLRRPLSTEQLNYAALDVAYLIPAFQRLQADLKRLGREQWAEETLANLFNTDRFLPDPENAYLRLGARRALPPRSLAVLQSLATWREHQSRRRNLPRNFVLKEKALVDITRRMPQTLRALRAIDSLHPREIQRHGETWLRHVRKAVELPADQLPEARPALDLRPYRKQIQELKRQAAQLADELSLPPELVATRRTVEALVRRHVTGKHPVLPEELRGWRRDLIGQPLLDRLRLSTHERP